MSEQETITAYPFHCPWCEYEFRKERYFGRHVFSEHPEKVLKDGFEPRETIRNGWR